MPPPFPASPCAACPRVARGLPMPCPAQTTNHARLCELAAAGHAAYVALLCDGMPAPAPAPPTVPVAESLRRIRAARECPSRTAPQCGCSGWATCLEGRGKGGQVSLSECVECVTAPP